MEKHLPSVMFSGSLWVSCSLEHSAKDHLTTLVPFMGPWFGPPSRSNFAILQPSLQMGFRREIKIRAVEASGYPRGLLSAISRAGSQFGEATGASFLFHQSHLHPFQPLVSPSPPHTKSIAITLLNFSTPQAMGEERLPGA